MIDSFVRFLLQNLHILLPIRQDSQIVRPLQFENPLRLQFQFVQPRSWYELALLFIAVPLFSIDEIVGEILEAYLLETA